MDYINLFKFLKSNDFLQKLNNYNIHGFSIVEYLKDDILDNEINEKDDTLFSFYSPRAILEFYGYIHYYDNTKNLI